MTTVTQMVREVQHIGPDGQPVVIDPYNPYGEYAPQTGTYGRNGSASSLGVGVGQQPQRFANYEHIAEGADYRTHSPAAAAYGRTVAPANYADYEPYPHLAGGARGGVGGQIWSGLLRTTPTRLPSRQVSIVTIRIWWIRLMQGLCPCTANDRPPHLHPASSRNPHCPIIHVVSFFFVYIFFLFFLFLLMVLARSISFFFLSVTTNWRRTNQLSFLLSQFKKSRCRPISLQSIWVERRRFILSAHTDTFSWFLLILAVVFSRILGLVPRIFCCLFSPAKPTESCSNVHHLLCYAVRAWEWKNEGPGAAFHKLLSLSWKAEWLQREEDDDDDDDSNGSAVDLIYWLI